MSHFSIPQKKVESWIAMKSHHLTALQGTVFSRLLFFSPQKMSKERGIIHARGKVEVKLIRPSWMIGVPPRNDVFWAIQLVGFSDRNSANKKPRSTEAERKGQQIALKPSNLWGNRQPPFERNHYSTPFWDQNFALLASNARQAYAPKGPTTKLNKGQIGWADFLEIVFVLCGEIPNLLMHWSLMFVKWWKLPTTKNGRATVCLILEGQP